jgi:hypothetical protein
LAVPKTNLYLVFGVYDGNLTRHSVKIKIEKPRIFYLIIQDSSLSLLPPAAPPRHCLLYSLAKAPLNLARAFRPRLHCFSEN